MLSKAVFRRIILFKTHISNKLINNRMITTTSNRLVESSKENVTSSPATQTSRKVKLYPGFQSSSEEIRQKLDNDSSYKEELFAKKVIENFYGLNELEFDEESNESEETSNLDEKELNVETLLEILKRENVQDLSCIELPKEVNYADKMLIGTCLSDKHLSATFIRLNRQYKKMVSSGEFLSNRMKLGKESKWCAVDLGSYVIHLFVGDEMRLFYDLETLWTCGAEFDESLLAYKRERDELERRIVYVEKNDDTNAQ